MIEIAQALARAVDALSFGPPVTHVYNPLSYAWPLHRQYLERFGAAGKEAVFVGMNPGPWGMAQTGVPFGEVAAVRDWMGLRGEVGRPPREHAKRPIEGLRCARSEVSGRRLWGWAAARFGAPDAFFARFFVLNYCPLVFMEDGARNRTPDKLPAAERAPLEAACDQALRASVLALGAPLVIGVGAWAEERARVALDGLGLRFGRILHPSPASPAANRGWEAQVDTQLAALGVRVP
ncbi:single-stranded DNA-binding protein [Myxococcota bacterium]|nr:single-stranded DNA-binding protein [Myxococcota bacterium]